MRAALDEGDFTEAFRAYGALPCREKRILWKFRGRVALFHRNNVVDFVLQLLTPWEGPKGPWRVEVDGETLVLGFDHIGYLSPAAHGPAEKAATSAQWGVWWYFRCER